MKVVHRETQISLAENVKIASSWYSRTKGLMFIKNMNGFDGLLIERCNSVHNCFVRFPLDLIFLTKNFEIVKIVRNFKPWRFTRMYFRASMVLELPNSSIPENVKEGDHLEVMGV